MIDWLRNTSADPEIALGGTALPVTIKRHPTARRLILRLAPDGSEVRVTMPRWGTTKEAVAFAESRSGWLEQQLSKLSPPECPLDTGNIRYRGEPLSIDWQPALPRKPVLQDGSIRLGGPSETRMRRLQRWLETQALELLRADLAEYCAAAQIADVPDIRLSRAKRRWGSCSSSGTLRINWRLVQAPDPVRRSVVAHEVAHLVHFDHSREFHALLARIFGDELPEADRWLKRDGRGLYSAFG